LLFFYKTRGAEKIESVKTREFSRICCELPRDPFLSRDFRANTPHAFANDSPQCWSHWLDQARYELTQYLLWSFIENKQLSNKADFDTNSQLPINRSTDIGEPKLRGIYSTDRAGQPKRRAGGEAMVYSCARPQLISGGTPRLLGWALRAQATVHVRHAAM